MFIRSEKNKNDVEPIYIYSYPKKHRRFTRPGNRGAFPEAAG